MQDLNIFEVIFFFFMFKGIPVMQGDSVLGWGVVRAAREFRVLRVHFVRAMHAHPLTLSPYVQMLARGIAGA